MAQSRPPPVRTHASVGTSSPPPLSPRTSEKKHHSRRKSGKDYVNSTSERKSSRPAPLTRKTTSQIPAKHASGRRERDEDERGGGVGGESFPQFCMSCEKQFLPANNTFLYCSEACRLHDRSSSSSSAHTYTTHQQNGHQTIPPSTPSSYYTKHIPFSSSSLHSTPAHEEGPDIIPRFSPTQSRPRSYFNSDPYPSSSSYHTYTSQQQGSPPSALDSLRTLAVALPKSSSSSRDREKRREEAESPASSISRTGSGVWNYMPFSGSKTAAATPAGSYQQAGYQVSQSYGAVGRSREDLYSYGKSHGANGYATNGGYGAGVVVSGGYTSSGGMGMDRPLPPRSGPGGYGHRPRSIDLVTPFSGGH